MNKIAPLDEYPLQHFKAPLKRKNQKEDYTRNSGFWKDEMFSPTGLMGLLARYPREEEGERIFRYRSDLVASVGRTQPRLGIPRHGAA